MLVVSKLCFTLAKNVGRLAKLAHNRESMQVGIVVEQKIKLHCDQKCLNVNGLVYALSIVL